MNKAILAIALTLYLPACSWRSPAPEQGDAQTQSGEVSEAGSRAPESIELYVSRSNMADTEFEQYKVSAGRLFAECGKIKAGRYVPIEQESDEVEADLAGQIGEAVQGVLSADAELEHPYDEPGSNRSMMDPGQLYLTLAFGEEVKSIKTSLDSVSEPTGSRERKLLKLLRLMRGASGEPLCGNREFYGVPAGL